jgi:hypothetical protein
MRWPPRGPLYIVCKRPGCEVVKEVKRPCEQREQKYCSQRCNALANQNIRRADRRAGLANSIRVRKQRVLDRVKGLDAVAAFRLGYKYGLYSKSYQLRQRYQLVKRDTPAVPWPKKKRAVA